MFSILGREGGRLCDGITRRELIRIGGLSTLGLSLPALLQAQQQPPPPGVIDDPTFGRAKNIICDDLGFEKTTPKPLPCARERRYLTDRSLRSPSVARLTYGRRCCCTQRLRTSICENQMSHPPYLPARTATTDLSL